MFSLWQLGLLALGYVLVLFLIAWWGDRAARRGHRLVNNAWTYSLGLGVYCTSWTYYGAVGEAATNGWNYLPIYLGPIITVLLGGSLIYKLVSVGQQHHITSIADFLAARYGKSRQLAVLVTLVAIIGVLPYIALQLKAVTLSFERVVGDGHSAGVNTALLVAALMAGFTLLFGTRHIDATEHQSGLMLAVSFESFIKLVAFLVVGLFCLFGLFDGPWDLWQQVVSRPPVLHTFEPTLFSQSFVTALLLSMVAILCLPRQFHAGVVENNDLGHLRTTRWVLPLYLFLFALFVLPVVAAGMINQPQLIGQADSYMLSLPLAEGNGLMSLIAFIGGIAAATGMVIVSTVALAIMLTNEILLPVWVQYRIQGRAELSDLSGQLRFLRRLSVVLLLGLAFLFHTLIDHFQGLARIGLISFAAVAQFAPALLGALYWRRGHKHGALIGLLLGFAVWVYCLLLPVMLPKDWVLVLNQHGLLGLGVLRPHALFGIEGLEPLTHGVFWSLALNTAAYIYFSRRSRADALDEAQATRFVDMPTDWWREGMGHPSITTAELLEVCERGLGSPRAGPLFFDYMRRRGVSEELELPAPLHLVRYVERLLAGTMGASTARIVMGSLLSKQHTRHADVVRMMDEASELIQFNHQLLRTTIETISQGICVVDRQMNVVAWNQAYVRLFDYPEGLIRLGRPIEEVYRYNAERGYYDGENLETDVHKRVQLLREGHAHQFERELPNGIVVEVRGTPMVGGGFVSTYMDITERKRDEMALLQINENLEQMVAERTRKLSDVNNRLAEANEGKTRFLAAAGHDLMQPLNAAQLFASSLRQQLRSRDEPGQGFQAEQAVLGHIDSSLQAAEQIISALLEISKLDTGTMPARVQPMPLSSLMRTLGQEFDALARASGLDFHQVPCSALVETDEALLRRVLQNLLSNAIRYTGGGRILFGCRRQAGKVRIEVWDTGPGIPPEQHEQIFREFQRLPQPSGRQISGLGLGLAIADRICRLLGHALTVRSWPGRGTVFSVTVPLAQGEAPPLLQDETPATPRDIHGTRVFCVDNDRPLLASLVAALESLGCEAIAAVDSKEAVALARQTEAPDVLLVDYQLDQEDGFQVIDALDACWDDVVPAILMTADRRPQVRARAREQGVGFMQKPISEGMLRRALEQIKR
ncbi:Na-solute symporter/sensory box histidinekinase [Alcanivorax hongdengensis A-11-3]|uniref:histidine kinase n=1 Tax=Alcanivorax hongdengensis A-11-3 TaxID=1177179 RepID=L0WIC1_9GAMM|nr:PAS domain-containing hybrid sensor histidine kinase/response regulator [Alcanivorax hongdengensis]EKF75882.1 Na-solute symporter/sensory box histidinekinase [Alcanivorax hongdengensis A-11-3]